jgi:hypothetical protein
MESLEAMFQRISKLEPAAWAALLAGWEPVDFKRNELITQARQVQNDMLLMLEGLQQR